MRDSQSFAGKRGVRIIFVAHVLDKEVKIMCGVFTQPVNVYTI